MESTEQQQAEHRKAYENLLRHQRAVIFTLVVIIVAMVIGQDLSRTALGVSYSMQALIVFVLTVFGTVFSLRNWRCPACRRYLGGSFDPEHCHRCGVRLRN